MKINKIIIISLALFIWTACENNNTTSSDFEPNSSWIFVANEGNMGQSNGTISMIDDFGNVYETEPIGDVVQSLEVSSKPVIGLLNIGSEDFKGNETIKNAGLMMQKSKLNYVIKKSDFWPNFCYIMIS